MKRRKIQLGLLITPATQNAFVWLVTKVGLRGSLSMDLDDTLEEIEKRIKVFEKTRAKLVQKYGTKTGKTINKKGERWEPDASLYLAGAATLLLGAILWRNFGPLDFYALKTTQYSANLQGEVPDVAFHLWSMFRNVFPVYVHLRLSFEYRLMPYYKYTEPVGFVNVVNNTYSFFVTRIRKNN